MIKYKCKKGLTLEDCELVILRLAVDKAGSILKKKNVNTPELQKIINIVELFLKKKKLVTYGGTAINSILPLEDQFYNKNTDIPDYDFFSPNAYDDTIELSNLYYENGYSEVEAKSGIHQGTYKIFVNFIPVADITFLNNKIFNKIKEDSICKEGILYAPPNFLRMSMYLELSRPLGDISRWEKVLKRITLLNKNFPLKAHNCSNIQFQRKMEIGEKQNIDEIYDLVKDFFIDNKLVFFGGYAISLYSKYMPNHLKKKLNKNPDFDVLSINPKESAENLKIKLNENGINNVSICSKPAIGEIISKHYEIKVGEDTVAFIYEPIGCHSYNNIKINNKFVKIATIDTMLSFYLAFLYADEEYYDTHRILCMSQYLFKVQQHNRLEQKGLLKRFSIKCYGHQETLEEIRYKKSKKFNELKNDKKSKKYKMYFLKYRPDEYNIKRLKKENNSSDKKENILDDKKENNSSDKKENILDDKKENNPSDKKENNSPINNISDKKENILDDKKENNSSDKKENNPSDKKENILDDKKENIPPKNNILQKKFQKKSFKKNIKRKTFKKKFKIIKTRKRGRGGLFI